MQYACNYSNRVHCTFSKIPQQKIASGNGSEEDKAEAQVEIEVMYVVKAPGRLDDKEWENRVRVSRDCS